MNFYTNATRFSDVAIYNDVYMSYAAPPPNPNANTNANKHATPEPSVNALLVFVVCMFFW